MLTGGVLDAVVIGGVVLANAVIGYFTESGAEKTMESLKDLVHPTAAVVRGGERFISRSRRSPSATCWC